MDWRQIPSLSALRAFEAAARTGSLSAAARELNVTHAAIAQHLRKLEEHVGRALMRREGRGMALTEDGQRLAQPLGQAFGQIADAMRAFIDSHHMLLEGAAGVAIAGFLDVAEDYKGKNVVIVVCGGNISRETLKQVI